MNRTIYLLMILTAALTSRAQFYGGYAIGTATSKSFKQYAEYLNTDPNVTDKLGNFWFSHGFTAGIEFPIADINVISFEYRQMTAQTSMAYSNLGRVEYQLSRKQYLLPVSVGHIEESKGSIVSAAFTVIVGLSDNSIERRYVDNPPGATSVQTFEGLQTNFGFGFTLMAASNHIGFISRLSWLGNLIPMKDVMTDMFDDSFYGSGAGNLGSYYLTYYREGEKENVQSDFRGVTFEIGLLIWLF